MRLRICEQGGQRTRRREERMTGWCVEVAWGFHLTSDARAGEKWEPIPPRGG